MWRQEGGLLAGCWSTSRQTRCWCACCLCLHLMGDLALFFFLSFFLCCSQYCWLSFIGSGRLRDAFPSDSFCFLLLAPSQIFTSLFFMTLSWHGRQQGNSRFCSTGAREKGKEKKGKEKKKTAHMVHSELFALQMPLLKY